MLNSKNYDFLRTNEHLGDNIVLLTLGGSRAYGTNNPDSDWDFRGVALNKPQDLIGLSNFEQVTDSNTDTAVYSFNKIIRLLSDCNPNVIEILGCKPEHYAILTPVGQQLIDNRKMFLSQKAVRSFGGYANQQLRRLQNALARDSYPQSEKEKHILGSCMNALMNFGERYTSFSDGSIKLYIDKSENEELFSEIFVDINLSHYPLRDYKNIWSDLNNIVKDYSKLNHRNNKKDDIHLNKHAMHLVRLYLMCLDILEKEEIVTYREDDIDLLMSIRNGKYQKEDKTFYPEFFEMINEYEKRMKYAAQNTNLPVFPNYKQIGEFMMDVNSKIIKTSM